jgi:hypothetical protein
LHLNATLFLFSQTAAKASLCIFAHIITASASASPQTPTQAIKTPHALFPVLHLYCMNMIIHSISNTWTAFVFGAVFNVLTAKMDDTLIAFVIKTVIGGVIWLAFQMVADYYKKKDAVKKKDDEHENRDQKREP